jgi:signal transduction histidine kinase
VVAEAYITLVHARIDSQPGDDSGEKLAAAGRALARARIVVEAVMLDAVDPGLEVALRPVDLQLLIEDVMQLLEPERAARDATVRTGALPTVTGDEALLGAVLRNLLLNGIRHGRPQGTLIEVSAERRDDTWRIAVSSDGPAISEDDREALFQPRLRRPPSTASRRTGLGLFICARIVARHGGQIGFERGPGEENVFVVTLPN